MYRTLALALLAAAAAPAAAAIDWTDWTSVNAVTATGTLGTATVTFTGPHHNWQTSGGTDYWRQGGVNPWPAYDAVSNLPTNNDFVAPNTDAVHTISFSKPVLNPYIAVISLGQPNINTSWTFSDPFTLVDQGQGFWGNGLFNIVGNTLTAGEAHGIIQFSGTFTSLTLRTSNTEFWSGLTIGTDGVVPEPATWALLIAGFGFVGAALRRRRSTAARA
jgi:hypothetical protein